MIANTTHDTPCIPRIIFDVLRPTCSSIEPLINSVIASSRDMAANIPVPCLREKQQQHEDRDGRHPSHNNPIIFLFAV